jgi:rubrerythrin
MSKWICHDCGKIIIADEAPQICIGCGTKATVERDGKVVYNKITKNWASKHPLGPVGKKAPEEILKDLRNEIETDSKEAAYYIAYSRVAARQGYSEISAFLRETAIAKLVQAGEEIELLGENVSESTEENLKKVYEGKIEDGARKTGFSKRATATGVLHGEHELLHEIARDDGDIGLALGNLLKRYFDVDIDE